jgi:anaerobic selenocysteine-containing dehydrogenase
MNEVQEAELRSQLILMWGRNPGKPYIMKRVLKRFMRYLKSN